LFFSAIYGFYVVHEYYQELLLRQKQLDNIKKGRDPLRVSDECSKKLLKTFYFLAVASFAVLSCGVLGFFLEGQAKAQARSLLSDRLSEGSD